MCDMRLWVPGWSSISTRICILNIMINITNFTQPYKSISQITPKKKKKKLRKEFSYKIDYNFKIQFYSISFY